MGCRSESERSRPGKTPAPRQADPGLIAVHTLAVLICGVLFAGFWLGGFGIRLHVPVDRVVCLAPCWGRPASAGFLFERWPLSLISVSVLVAGRHADTIYRLLRGARTGVDWSRQRVTGFVAGLPFDMLAVICLKAEFAESNRVCPLWVLVLLLSGLAATAPWLPAPTRAAVSMAGCVRQLGSFLVTGAMLHALIAVWGAVLIVCIVGS